jgi:nitronate monooxygenase
MPRDLRALLRRPLVIAPMAGGPTTSQLVVSASESGAFGMVAGGYKTADDLLAEISAVRASTDEAFGVNLFVPGRRTSESERLDRYVRSLAPDAEAVGARCGEATWDDDLFEDKLDACVSTAPPLVSFTFGCPSPEAMSACRAAGSLVAVTVTTPAEARQAAGAGADALCVQGPEAGAHRGTFVNDDGSGTEMGLLELIGEIARVTDLPQLAAGGIVESRHVRSVLDAGAVAAQCGTAFLRCPESGAHPAHKAALADRRYSVTVVTRAFSGRPARGLLNRFVRDHPDAPAAYPEINNATRPIRSAAAQRGDTDRMSLWAGEGFRSATERAAGEIVEMLCEGVIPGVGVR